VNNLIQGDSTASRAMEFGRWFGKARPFLANFRERFFYELG
jgi:hypothetical protein